MPHVPLVHVPCELHSDCCGWATGGSVVVRPWPRPWGVTATTPHGRGQASTACGQTAMARNRTGGGYQLVSERRAPPPSGRPPWLDSSDPSRRLLLPGSHRMVCRPVLSPWCHPPRCILRHSTGMLYTTRSHEGGSRLVWFLAAILFLGAYAFGGGGSMGDRPPSRGEHRKSD